MFLTANYIYRPKLAICGTPSAIIMVISNEDFCAGRPCLTFHSQFPKELKVVIQPEKKKEKKRKLQSNLTFRNTQADIPIPSVHCALGFSLGSGEYCPRKSYLSHYTLRSSHILGTQHQHGRPLQNPRIFERNYNLKYLRQNKKKNEILETKNMIIKGSLKPI